MRLRLIEHARRAGIVLLAAHAVACTAWSRSDDDRLIADAAAVETVRRVDSVLSAGGPLTGTDVAVLRDLHRRYPGASALGATLRAALARREDWRGLAETLEAVPPRLRPPEDTLALADAYFRAGEYDAALQRLQPLLSTPPSRPTAARLAAEAELRLGRPGSAAAHLDGAWEAIVASRDAEAIALRGLVHFYEGDLVRSAAVLEEALRLAPALVAAHNTLARVAVARGDEEAAQSHLAAVRDALDRAAETERRAYAVVQLVRELQEAWAARDYRTTVDRAERLLPQVSGPQRQVVGQYLVLAYRALGRSADAARIEAEWLVRQ